MTREAAIANCKTCNMPIRVIFENDEIVEVFAVCGHVKMEDHGERKAEQAQEAHSTGEGQEESPQPEDRPGGETVEEEARPRLLSLDEWFEAREKARSEEEQG